MLTKKDGRPFMLSVGRMQYDTAGVLGASVILYLWLRHYLCTAQPLYAVPIKIIVRKCQGLADQQTSLLNVRSSGVAFGRTQNCTPLMMSNFQAF